MAAEQLTTVTVNANVQPFTDALKTATTAANQFQQAAAQLSNTNTQTASQVTTTAAAFNKLVASLDPAVKSANQYAAAQKQIQAGVNAGLADQERANQLLTMAADKYNTLEAQARKAAQAQIDAQKQAAAQSKVAYDQLMASINPVVAQQQAQAKAQTTVNNALKNGQISAIGAVGAMQQFNAQQKVMGDGTKLTAQQLFVLEAQIRQFGDQVLAGGGIFRPLAMQAPVAIEALGGVSNALRLLRNNLTTILAVGGIGVAVAALGALAVSAESNQRSLNNLSNGLQKYGGDFKANAALINDAAKEMAATTKIGTQEARDAMATLAAAPGFIKTKENFINTTKAAMDMAASMNISTQEAAQYITTIFADPVAAALKGVNDHIEGFDTTFVAAVRDMVQQGRQADAINVVFNKLTASMKNTADNVTPLQAAMIRLREALTGVGQDAGKAGSGLGTELTSALAGVVDDITTCVKALGSLSSELKKLGIDGKTQIEVVAGVFLLQLVPAVRAAEGALIRMAAVTFGQLIANLAQVVLSLNAVTAAGNQAAIATTLSKVPYVGGAIALGIGAYNLATTQNNLNLATLPKDSPLWNSVPLSLQLNYPNSPLSAQSGPVSFAAPTTAALGQAVDIAQTFQGKTGTDLNAWLNQNGAQIDAARSAWCAAFVNSALASVGIQGSGSNVATSFLNWGTQRQTAQRGDVLVQAKGLAPGVQGGHVGLATGNTRIGPNGELQIEMVSGNVGGGQGYTGPNMVATNWVPASSVQIRGASAAAANAVPSVPLTTPKGPAGPPTADEEVRAFLAQAQVSPGQTMGEQQRQLQQILATTNQMIQSGKYQGDALDLLKQKALDLSKAIYTTVDPLTTLTREQQRQLNVENELNPAMQKVTEAQQAFTEQMRTQMGMEPTQQQLDQVKVQTLELLASGYRNQINAADQAAASQGRLADAMEKSAQAALHQANYEKARQQIAGNAPKLTAEQAAAVELLTKKLDDGTAAMQRNALAQQKIQDEGANRLLDTQEKTLTESAQNQAAALAQTQRYNEQVAQGIDPNSPAAIASRNRASALGARTVNVDREKAAWQEVNQAASQAIDDIGAGLEQALYTGKWTDFGNVAKKVLNDISSEFLKLALLNPLKNALIPGSNAPSLFDLFNNAGGAAASNLSGNVGGGSSVIGGSSAAGGGGLFGALGSLGSAIFGREGLFGSQGLLFGPGGWFGSAAPAIALGTEVPLGSIAASASSFAATLPAASAADSLLLAGLYHSGGLVGEGSRMRVVPATSFHNAPRLHKGGRLMTYVPDPPSFTNDNEVPAILQRGEMVLTQAQQRAVGNRMRFNSDRPIVMHPTFNINTPDANSFRKSQSQIEGQMARTMAKAARRM